MNELSLIEKGPVRPAPTLSKHPQRVSSEIQSWPGVVAAAHWNLYWPDVVDGSDFYVGERELGHIHLNGHAHIATTRGLRDRLLKSGEAQTFPWSGGYEDWVMYPIGNAADADHAIGLFRLNYERLQSSGMDS